MDGGAERMASKEGERGGENSKTCKRSRGVKRLKKKGETSVPEKSSQITEKELERGAAGGGGKRKPS